VNRFCRIVCTWLLTWPADSGLAPLPVEYELLPETESLEMLSNDLLDANLIFAVLDLKLYAQICRSSVHGAER
jgi:hypothetical protein